MYLYAIALMVEAGLAGIFIQEGMYLVAGLAIGGGVVNSILLAASAFRR